MRFYLFLIVCVLATGCSSPAKKSFLGLFEIKKPIIAAVMIPKEIDTPEQKEKALLWAKEQLKIAEAQNMDGILFEFRGGKILEPEISKEKFSNMVEISKQLVQEAKDIVVGVEILWHYPEETLRLAKSSGARFVRLDFFVDEVVADNEKVPIAPDKVLAYRKIIGAEDIALLTDIQVKYSKMLDPHITLAESAKRAKAKGSDGVIVTSTKSGKAPGPERPKLAKKGSGSLPVVIGSGFSYKNAKELLEHADAAIVGTSISEKTGGPLIPKKVGRLMKIVNEVRSEKE